MWDQGLRVGLEENSTLEVPVEINELAQRVRELPESVRTELEPAMDDVLEQAIFRSRVLTLAKDALVRFRHDLELMRFDLDRTREEREALRRRLAETGRYLS
jgi:hypothetical protein